MKPQLFALLTAVAWGVGGYFEKKGMHAFGKPFSPGGHHDPHCRGIAHPGSSELSPVEDGCSGRPKVAPHDDSRRRGGGGIGGDALFLPGDQRGAAR